MATRHCFYPRKRQNNNFGTTYAFYRDNIENGTTQRNQMFDKRFIPTSAKEAAECGITQFDIILFSGDAYVDHPSFSVAVIARILEAEGYSVAVVPQPNWKDDLRDFRKLGAPRLFFGVSAGNMDSMVNHYTAARRLRSNDAYTPGGRAGARPDYATTVYTKILKQIYPDTPVVIGGIEASLRRLAHYDYWQDKILPSILIESGADLLCYGLGDKVMPEVARFIENGFNRKRLHTLRQTAYITDREGIERLDKEETLFLHLYEECLREKPLLGKNFVETETQSNVMEPKRLVEGYGERFVVVNAPYPCLTTEEIDRTYDLPFMRAPHPRYRNKGAIPSWEMIKFSVNTHRGCFGGCSFCTISAHQGKFISSRSEESILKEVRQITQMEGFAGYLSDVGGPSANMYGMSGRNKKACRVCKRPSCIHPNVCPNLDNSHERLLKLYKKVDAVNGIKKSFIGSGIRYDLFDQKFGDEYLREVIKNHTSGKLKVAPEHTEEKVLKMMRKPSFSLFEKLHEKFERICAREGLPYLLIPYFISSHPACRLDDMKRLAEKMKKLHIRLDQVQDFTPTPMTLSSTIYCTGIDPYTDEPVFTEHDPEAKKAQKSLFFAAENHSSRHVQGKTPRQGNNRRPSGNKNTGFNDKPTVSSSSDRKSRLNKNNGNGDKSKMMRPENKGNRGTDSVSSSNVKGTSKNKKGRR